ncbi:MAG: NAD(P)-binding domain-containing protein [Thermoplasmata archaeon]|jgi:predicted dinucleotide-binding enzyme|nr:NAD(P)-binding domain-containing protein [Thermoplasmata archaeon]
MRVGILGSGDVAKTLGSGFVELGHEVKLGSRTPESDGLVAWKKAAGERATLGTFADAAAFGEVVVVSTRGVENENAIRLAGLPHFAGKVVIDTTNPLKFVPNAMPTLAYGGTDSAGERVQKLLPEAQVVKAFNSVGNVHMFRPKFSGGPPDMFYCGNDAGAKKKVAEWLRSFGWNPVDTGGIESSRELESLCILWVTLGALGGSWDIAFKILHK